LPYRLLYDKIIFPSEFFGLARLRKTDFKVYGHRKIVSTPLLFTIKKNFGYKSINVLDLQEKVIGTVEMKFGFLPKFIILDSDGNEVYVIKGPRNRLTVYSGTEKKSQLRKQYGSVKKGNLGNLIIHLTFPSDATRNKRVLLIAATIFIDIMYFDTPNDFRSYFHLTKHIIQWLKHNPLLEFRTAQRDAMFL